MHADTARHTAQLGDWVANLQWDRVPDGARRRLRLVLLDLLGVTLLGARDPEQQRLVAAWDAPGGPAPVFGAGVRTTVDAAAWLNATALVRLELDEGNKFAKGHPAAHGFPAVLALGAARGADGPELLTALLAAYEVASRFGRATALRQGLHPHGSWGVTGAAAGCARLLGLDGRATAAAIDAGAGMPVAAHFASATDGNRVRDAWMGAANTSGLAASRMASAGVADNTGTAAYSLGEVLGSFRPEDLTEELGERWEVELGYFKQHAACSFTHPAADALLALTATGELPRPEQVDSVVVETHSLAVGLDSTTWDNRLAAMFSLPFVAAAAIVHGRVTPDVTAGAALHDPAVRQLASRVSVLAASDLDARLPDERPVRVTVTGGGRSWTLERPNPEGDSSFHPFDEARLRGVLAELLGSTGPVDAVADVIDLLATGTADAGALCSLAALGATSASPRPTNP